MVHTWEYRVIQTTSAAPALDAELTMVGAQGWEAVGIAAYGDGHLVVLFKRLRVEAAFDDAAVEEDALEVMMELPARNATR